MRVLSIFRLVNVILIGVTVLMGGYYVNHGIDYLFHKIFYLYILGTMCIGAGGYVLNDVFDVEIDAFNRPNTNIVGTRLSPWVAILIGVFCFAFGITLLMFTYNTRVIVLGCLTIVLLVLYAKYLKQTLWLGNWVIALLAMFNVWVGGLYFFLSQSVLWMGLFAFLITLIREMVKDIEDIYGDALVGAVTLPMVLGIEKTKKILFVLALGLEILLLTSLFILSYQSYIFIFSNLILVQIPLLYCMLALKDAFYKEDFHQVSVYLKLVMLGGMLMGMQLG